LRHICRHGFFRALYHISRSLEARASGSIVEYRWDSSYGELPVSFELIATGSLQKKPCRNSFTLCLDIGGREDGSFHGNGSRPTTLVAPHCRQPGHCWYGTDSLEKISTSHAQSPAVPIQPQLAARIPWCCLTHLAIARLGLLACDEVRSIPSACHWFKGKGCAMIHSPYAAAVLHGIRKSYQRQNMEDSAMPDRCQVPSAEPVRVPAALRVSGARCKAGLSSLKES
jgi:hypothetical protein